jgi:multiple sugar transport system permease protein
LMAAATITLVPTLLVFIFTQRYFVQGIALTGFGGR